MAGKADIVNAIADEAGISKKEATAAFDAFVGYRRVDGSEGFLGIEVKLAEGFSDTPHDKARYEAFSSAPG